MSYRLFLFFTLFLTVFASQALPQQYDASFDSPIVDAANKGDRFEVARLMKVGTSPNTKGAFGTTALMRAAYIGDVEIAKLLIDNGARVNDKDIGGATALHIAARRGNTAMVELLMKYGANPEIKDKEGFDPTSRATKSKHLKIVDKIKTETSAAALQANTNPLIKKADGKPKAASLQKEMIVSTHNHNPEPIIHLEPDHVIEHVALAPLDTPETVHVVEVVPVAETKANAIKTNHDHIYPQQHQSTVQDLRSLAKPKVTVNSENPDEDDNDSYQPAPQPAQAVQSPHLPTAQKLSHKQPVTAKTNALVKVEDEGNVNVAPAEAEQTAASQPDKATSAELEHHTILTPHHFIEIAKAQPRETANKPTTPPAGVSVAEAVKLPDDIDLHKDFHLVKRSHLQKPDWVNQENSSPENSWIEVTGLPSKQDAIHFWQDLTRDEYFQGSSSKLIVGKTVDSPAKLHIGIFTSTQEALQTCSVVRKQNSRLLCYVLKGN